MQSKIMTNARMLGTSIAPYVLYQGQRVVSLHHSADADRAVSWLPEIAIKRAVIEDVLSKNDIGD